MLLGICDKFVRAGLGWSVHDSVGGCDLLEPGLVVGGLKGPHWLRVDPGTTCLLYAGTRIVGGLVRHSEAVAPVNELSVCSK